MLFVVVSDQAAVRASLDLRSEVVATLPYGTLVWAIGVPPPPAPRTHTRARTCAAAHTVHDAVRTTCF